jgi:hypothetical protein
VVSPVSNGDTPPDTSAPPGAQLEAAGLDLTRPHPARIYDFRVGGKDHFAADRRVGAQVAELAPWVVSGARGNRAFLGRAVSWLAEADVDQFIDIARALLARDPRTITVAGDARSPDTILTNPEVRAHLDLNRPAAVLLVAILHFIVNQNQATRIVAGLLRTHEQVTALFDGFEVITPGIVPANQWRPHRGRPGPAIPALAGIGVLPAPVVRARLDTPSRAWTSHPAREHLQDSCG